MQIQVCSNKVPGVKMATPEGDKVLYRFI